MANAFGNFVAEQTVTIGSSQTVVGAKKFKSKNNVFAGLMDQPYINADAVTLTPTILSYLAGTTSNIQSQIDGNGSILTALDQALQALQPAPNATTVQFNNSVLCSDPNTSDISGLLTDTGISFANENLLTAGLSLSGTDLTLDAGTNRLLLNAHDAEFYIGQYSTPTAPCIQSLGNGGFLNLNSRGGSATLGDSDGGYNGTVITVNDGNQDIFLNAAASVVIGDVGNNVNQTKVTVDVTNAGIALFAHNLISIGNTNTNAYLDFDVANNVINHYVGDFNVTAVGQNFIHGDGGVFIDCTVSDIVIGDTQGNGSSTQIYLNDDFRQISFRAEYPVMLNSIGTVRYKTGYYSANTTLQYFFPYACTFNGTSLIATLPVVNSSNAGIQFIITNVNASALTVNSSSSQLIYAKAGVASATTRSLSSGHSCIFTAILTVGISSYGWSMI